MLVTILADLHPTLEGHVSASQSIHKSNRGLLHLLNMLVNASPRGSIPSSLLLLFDSELGYKQFFQDHSRRRCSLGDPQALLTGRFICLSIAVVIFSVIAFLWGVSCVVVALDICAIRLADILTFFA
jgi:hypothetical protein